MTRYYCGIDPGKQGAIAFISEDRSDYQVYDCGTAEELYSAISSFTILMRNAFIEKAGIEDVHAMYNCSAKNTFEFGYTVGAFNAILYARMIPYQKIPPKAWQKGVIPPIKDIKGLDRNKRKAIKKKAHVEIAQKMFPKAELYTPRGRALDGRADALLIADYVKRNHR